ncbi:hypothetical protein EMIT051CA3_50143 [Pseudomonas chlororaphis]
MKNLTDEPLDLPVCDAPKGGEGVAGCSIYEQNAAAVCLEKSGEPPGAIAGGDPTCPRWTAQQSRC